MWEKYGRTTRVKDENVIGRMRIACWINKVTKHRLTICNTHCFSTTTMVARTQLNIMLYVHCLYCYRDTGRCHTATVLHNCINRNKYHFKYNLKAHKKLPVVLSWQMDFSGVRGGAVGWSTALQVGRSRVRFPMVSLQFFTDIILPAALWPWGRLRLWQKWVPGTFPGG